MLHLECAKFVMNYQKFIEGYGKLLYYIPFQYWTPASHTITL